MGRKLLFVAVLSTFLSGLFSHSLAAQESYKSDPLDPAFVMPDSSKYDKSKKDQKLELTNLEKGVKAARNASQETADNVLKGAADLGAAKTELDRYYNGLLFPSMTQVDDESLSKLGDLREGLLKQIQGTSNDSAIRKHMLDELVLPYFSRVASDSGYHPAVRLNAVLVIGNLNRRDGERNVEPSLPMEAALQTLVNLANAAETPPYLKIGALAGVLRHAVIDGQLKTKVLDNQLREQAIQLAISVLDATAPASAPDAAPLTDEQYWMRRQAVQILGKFRAPGADGKAVIALRNILDDQTAPLWLAADAIEAYGDMVFVDAAQAEVPKAVKSIGMTVSRFFKADLQSLDDYIAAIRENRMIDKRSKESDKADTNAGDATGEEGGTSSGVAAGKGTAGGRGSANPTAEASAKVEVPNYKINDVRQRSKSIVFIARRALDGLAPKRRSEVKPPENLKKLAVADPETVKVIDQMVMALDTVMVQTDLAPPKAVAATTTVVTGRKPEKPESNDERLRNSLKAGISAVESVIGVTAPAEQPTTKSALGG